MNRNLITQKIKTAFAWVLSLIVILPVYLVVVNSLKTSSEANSMSFSLPLSFQWGNYIETINKGHLIRAFFNSLLISSASVMIGIIVTAMAAFILSRNRTKLNKFIYNYFFFGLVASLNYITTINILKIFKLQNTYLGIILVFATLGIPFAMFLYYGFISNIPKELDEAAILDGCNLVQLFYYIIFPLLKPVTITGITLNFLGAWNDFVTPLYLLNSEKKLGMVNSIYNFFGSHFNDWNMIFANIVMAVIPILILYIFGQKYIISGMMTGSIKG